MYPFRPALAVVVFLIAFLTAYVIDKKRSVATETGRNETIDGLRGFLAIGVFIHHSVIWYPYILTGNWKAPDSNFFNQIGQTSVTLFFMITSFLFITKLFESKEKEINWQHFFKGRFFRIVPMYYFSLILIILIVMHISGWHLSVGVFEWLKSILNMALFSIHSSPNINLIAATNFVNAGIVWTLTFEWAFYFSLPIIVFVFLKQKPAIIYVLVGLVFVYFLVKGIDVKKLHHLLSFVAGAFAAVLNRYSQIKRHAQSIIVSALLVVALFLIGQFRSTESILCKMLITFVFSSVALGNSFFNVFKNSTLKLLGDISYSTYLLHGILLFMVMYFGFGVENLQTISAIHYSYIILAITPILVIISFLGYTFIEQPCIKYSKKFIKKLN